MVGEKEAAMIKVQGKPHVRSGKLEARTPAPAKKKGTDYWE